MAGLLYFVPGAGTQQAATKALRKLAPHALADVNTVCGCDKGPGGLRGSTIAPVPEPPGQAAAALYHPDEQTWLAVNGPSLTAESAEHPPVGTAECADGQRDDPSSSARSAETTGLAGPPSVVKPPSYWLGYEKARPPRPEDLARPVQHRGHPVTLGDGASWLAPVARLYTGRTAFPRKLTRENGQWMLGDIADGCATLWDVACRYFDEMQKAAEEEEYSLTESDVADMAAIALAANYRLGPEEIALLGLFDTRRTVDVLNALIDLPSVAALRKKAPAPGGSSTGPGEAV